MRSMNGSTGLSTGLSTRFWRECVRVLLIALALCPAPALAVPEDFGKKFDILEPPRALPPLAWQNMAADMEGPEDFAGQPLIINLWAGWCGPCVAELPALTALSDMLAGRAKVLAVSVERGGQPAVEAFLQRHALKTPQLGFDPRADIPRQIEARGLPTTLLINSAHEWVATVHGDLPWDDAALVAALEDLLQIPAKK